LSNCGFSGNANSSTGFGSDIAYNSGNSLYTSTNTVGTCSDSLTPHIKGTSTNQFDLNDVFCTNNMYFTTCKVRINVDIIFYLKPGGINSITCIKYTSPCKTIDYVMIEIVNKTEESIIYIDSGTYDYNVIGSENSETGAYFDRAFNLIGYILGPSVRIDDINTYPIIICNSSSDGISFYLYEDIIASFQYVKFIIGNNSLENRWLIMSFLFIYCFFFFFLIKYLIYRL
jgi:hypothetical protein